MQRRKFSREFKVEAVKLMKERGVSAAQAARDLDIHENVLRKWVKEFGSDPAQAFPGQGQMKPEQQEIERLRREVNKLRAERDILKRPQPSSRRKRHEVRFHCEAPECLAGGMAMRCNGRVPVRLPCLAESLAQRQIPQRRSGRPPGEGKLPCQRSDLRR
jgi:transposase